MEQYIVWILVGGCIIMHLWMMIKGHGKHHDVEKDEADADKNKNEDKNKHQHGNCCH